VLLFEICWQQILFGLYWSSAELAMCFGPLEITIMERGDWCEEL